MYDAGSNSSGGGRGAATGGRKRPLSPSETSTPSTVITKRAHARVLLLYAADWVVVVVVTAVSQIILIPDTSYVMFTVTNPNIQQRHIVDRFNIVRAAVTLSTSIPIITMFLWLGYFKHPFSDVHQAALGLGMALSFCALFTAIFKQMCAILSPDFLSRCRLDSDVFERAFLTGASLGIHNCTGSQLGDGARYYPSFTASIPACGLSYLSMFASRQLGLWLHPQTRHWTRQLAPQHAASRNRPGQTVVSFICLLPVAGAMVFPAVESKYFGAGSGWGYASSVLTGVAFALWAHVIYCYDMPAALVGSHAV
ncbi:hypothetical protein IWQ56_006202 [Coemansia nantahalensis]|nr:hypothetical protein IWQ56_006202 [Coemansia nantahalensis]